MKLLYATTNNSKIYNMKRRLSNFPIEIISPKDLNIKLTVIEDGDSAVENAIKKATAYFKATGIPTIAGDSGLYIENIPEEKQPGLFVRRVNGKELTDDEMIDYYSRLVDSIGGKTIAYYITGLALVNEDGMKMIEIKEDKFILTSKLSQINHRGNPLDVMSIDPNINKYYTEMSDEDFKGLGYVFDKKCVEFVEKNLLDNNKKLQKHNNF